MNMVAPGARNLKLSELLVMREAFERWAVVEGLPVNKGSKKEYLNVKTRLAWRAWKAGVLSVANPR